MSDRLTRRQLLTAAGTAGMIAVTGCQSAGRSDRPRRTEEVLRAPASSAVGDPLPIRLVDFEPNASVLLKARATDHRGVTFSATEGLRTGDDGTARVSDFGIARDRRASTWIGSDSGRQPGGRSAGELLFRSMRPHSIVRPEPAGELLTPDRFLIGGLDTVDVRLEASYRARQPAATRTITRVYTNPAVSRRLIAADDLVGWLYTPSESGPHPGVIVLHGSGGDVPHGFSRMLATHGYATLALQYFGAAGQPPYLRDVSLEYFDRAVRWLTSRSAVVSEGVGFIGASRGAEPALLTAAAYDGPTTVIGYSGSGVIATGISGSGIRARPTGEAAWTENGAPIVPADPMQTVYDSAEDAYQHRCDAGAAVREIRDRVPETALNQALVPVERIEGPVLLLAGADDRLWPAPPLSALAIDRLQRHAHPHPYGLRTYCGAGHAFWRPYRAYTGRLTSEGYGGTPRTNARAAATSWLLVLAYLQHGIGRETPLRQSIE